MELRRENTVKHLRAQEINMMWVARYAEAMADQALSDDLWELVADIRAVLNAAERRRYRSPRHGQHR